MSKKQKKSEIRENYIHDRFVIIAPLRGKRPRQIKEEQISPRNCPFCPQNLDKKKALLTIGNGRAWQVKVIPNKYPAVSLDNPSAYGQQEVVVETPDHTKQLEDLKLEHIVKILQAYSERVKEISKNKKIKHIFIFKNFGGRAGASIQHSHSQIFATGFLTPHIVQKLTRAKEYQVREGICYYCNQVLKARKSKRLVFEDKYLSVFTPFASTYNYEVWFIPKRHVDNISLLTKKELFSIARTLKKILLKLDSLQLPYNFYFHQAVTDTDEHFYLRVCPRRAIWAAVELGSRLIINSVAPEEAAAFYRK